MSKIWTDPNVWDVAEPITKLKQNNISNNLAWLKDRPRNVISTRGGGNIAIVMSTTVWQELSDALFTMTITTSVDNEDVFLYTQINWRTGGAVNSAYFLDYLVDDTFYVSSGNGTPLTGGARTFYNCGIAAALQPLSVFKRYTVPVAGTHTFKIRLLGAAADTVTFINTASVDIEVGVLDL